MRGRIFMVVLIVLAGVGMSQAEEFDPPAIYLTWQRDPTTSMTIDWHTLPEHGSRATVVQYKKLGTEAWREAVGNAHPSPFSDRTIHRVELTGLAPATAYRFRFGKDSKAYVFRTMPADLSNPVRFVTGGDLSIGETFRRTNRVAMRYEPDFIVWGGDLAYANSDPEHVDRWYDWFAGIKETLIDEHGRVVPILVAIGNHEVFGTRRLIREGSAESPEEAERLAQAQWGLGNGIAGFFFDLFAMPGRPSYNLVDFGDYMTVFLLDSNHISAVAGEQSAWLAEQLAARQNVPHVFPIYHIPAYPSHRSFDGSTSALIRRHWIPLFERYGIRLAFENHDHTYKRTHPIREGKISEDGIVYLGDGAWGVGTRSGENFNAWYIARGESKRHAIAVTLHGTQVEVVMVDEDGEVFDRWPDE